MIAKKIAKFNSVLETIKDKEEVLKKVLLGQDNTLLHFAIANKSTEAFKAILKAVKDDKEILKEVLTTKIHHRIFYQRTPLELCIYHYNQRNDYHNKEYIEIILDSAREDEVLEDVLVASGIKKNLVKELSTQGDNDTTIKALQQNQKAEERCATTVVAVALAGLILTAVLASWIVALATVFTSAAIGCGVYKFSQPSTKMLETDTNQENAKSRINAKEQTV